ncbi:MAG: domain / band 7 family rane protein [Pedosphaera sp.]|nr:domain / band 7 family rane protein [Pedosphaera sp.]
MLKMPNVNLRILFNWIKWGLALLVVVILVLKSVVSTGTTEVGVHTVKWSLFGKSGVENKVYQPGATYFFLPIFNEWETFDARLQIVEMTANTGGGDRKADDIPFKTKDGNDIRIDVIFTYRVDPQKAPYIRQFVAKDMVELKEKVFRTVARSKPRDYLGEYSTEEFYHAENRNRAAENAKQGLQAILSEYGIIVENVALMDYRFNADYQMIITNKKIADTKTKTLISERDSTVEMNKKLLQDALGEVNKVIAQADGQYQEAVLGADAYFQQQTNLAAATLAEGTAEAASIKKMREAMMNEGGLIQVKMAIAENLKGKRIIMIPTGTANSFNLQTLDVNDILRQVGFTKPK